MTTACYTQYRLPQNKTLPNEYYEVYLPLPYGRGNYSFKFLKCKEPVKGKDTVTVMALSRLVRVINDTTGYTHFETLVVEPYKRSLSTYHLGKAKKRKAGD